jgi:hypothetical protein
MACEPITDSIKLPEERRERVRCAKCDGHLFTSVYTLERSSYSKAPIKQQHYNMCIKCRNIIDGEGLTIREFSG